MSDEIKFREFNLSGDDDLVNHLEGAARTLINLFRKIPIHPHAYGTMSDPFRDFDAVDWKTVCFWIHILHDHCPIPHSNVQQLRLPTPTDCEELDDNQIQNIGGIGLLIHNLVGEMVPTSDYGDIKFSHYRARNSIDWLELCKLVEDLLWWFGIEKGEHQMKEETESERMKRMAKEEMDNIDTLENLCNDYKNRLDQLVEQGIITQEDADNRLIDFRERLTGKK